jgi:Uma2 family endonuclease
MNLLVESLECGWKGRTDFFAAGNMFVYFSESQARKNDFRGPDVFVVLNTEWHERKSWVVWEEDGRTPDVVIELTSESTEAVDRGEKMEIYARRLHVSHYYLFDPWTAKLEGYILDLGTKRYRPLPALPNGDVPCDVLGLSLGARAGTYRGIECEWLRWLGPDGQPFPTLGEAAQAEAERARAEAERAQGEAARVGVERDEALRLLEEYTRRFGSLPG